MTTERQNERLVARLRFAALREEAVVEDVGLRAPHGLDPTLLQKLEAGDWTGRKLNLPIVGPTASAGRGSPALGQKTCCNDRYVAYHRLTRLLETLALASDDGRSARLLNAIGHVSC